MRHMKHIRASELRLYLRVTLKAMAALAVAGIVVVAVRYLGGGADDTSGQWRFDVSGLAEGRTRTFGWEGRPVIVLRRSDATIAALGDALAGDSSPGWFVARAGGTATGCTLVWQPRRERFRESCGEAAWDAAGRPLPGTDAGPLNVPPHHFITDHHLILGERRAEAR